MEKEKTLLVFILVLVILIFIFKYESYIIYLSDVNIILHFIIVNNYIFRIN